MESGFTVIEAIVASLILGCMMLAVSPYVNVMFAASHQAYSYKQERINQLIGRGMIEWSKTTGLGELPAAYSGTPTSGAYNGRQFVSAPYDVTDTSADNVALQQALTQYGAESTELNDDGSANANVRVYQVVKGLSINAPVFGLVGDSATLVYDYGVIYSTECRAANTACNPTGATGIPGDSPVLTASNIQTWTTSGSDSRPERISTLPVQKELLRDTVTRINVVRDHLRSYFNAQQLAGPPASTTNFYSYPTGAGAPNLAGASAASNQGCYDGWYDLSAANVNIIAQIGLSTTEYATTPWGGSIEFCRDFDPTTTKGAGKPPFAAALRINRTVTSGDPPSPTPALNLVFSM